MRIFHHIDLQNFPADCKDVMVESNDYDAVILLLFYLKEF